MPKPSLAVRTALALPLLGLACACGAKVVFVGDDGGEGGAPGGSPSVADAASTGSATSTASTSVSSSSGFMSPCERLCMDHAACFGGDACLAQCEALIVSGCENQSSQYILCLAHNLAEDCTLGPACDGETAVYENCFAPTIFCDEARCEATPMDSCFCAGACDTTQLTQRCDVNDDFYQCSCEADGVSVGECTQSRLICDLDEGCCKELWLLTLR